MHKTAHKVSLVIKDQIKMKKKKIDFEKDFLITNNFDKF